MCVGVSGMFVCVRHIGLSVVLCVRERQRKREMKEISFYLFLLSSSLKNKSRLQKTHRSTRITSVKVLSAKKGIKERKEARRFVSSHKSFLCFPSLQKLKVRECERHVGKDRFLCFTVFSPSCQSKALKGQHKRPANIAGNRDKTYSGGLWWRRRTKNIILMFFSWSQLCLSRKQEVTEE